MDLLKPAEASAAPSLRERDQIAERFKWDLTQIYPDWNAWHSAYAELDRKIDEFAALRGSLARGSNAVLAVFVLRDAIGQLEYKVWYFASLCYDQDQRDNQVNAKRQEVQILFAKAAQASAWFDPELLTIPLDTVRGWMDASSKLAVYRFAIEDLYRQQEHVLDDKGERLLSLSSRFSSAPNDAYAALSTADVKHPTVVLPSGGESTLTYGQYRAILATNPNQEDRAPRFTNFTRSTGIDGQLRTRRSTTALQRDWFHAQARGYRSTLDAALHGNNIPTAVVENLISRQAGTIRFAGIIGFENGFSVSDVSLIRHGDSARGIRSQVSVRHRRRRLARLSQGARRRLPARYARCSERTGD
jgi:oligoendopeptidase F